MPFTPKAWQNAPSTVTPINAAALTNMETRLAAYSDTLTSGGAVLFTQPGDPDPDPADHADGTIWIELLEMSTVFVRNHASTSKQPQVVPLTGKANGRDLWVMFAVPATATAASPWVEHGSYLGGSGGYYLKLWRLPAADNTSGVTSLSVDLNAAASIAAVIWETTEVLDGSVYFTAIGTSPPTGATPALWGHRPPHLHQQRPDLRVLRRRLGRHPDLGPRQL